MFLMVLIKIYNPVILIYYFHFEYIILIHLFSWVPIFMVS